MNRLLTSACLLPLLSSPGIAQTITAALSQDIRSSNPGVNRDGNTDIVMLHVVEGLVGYSQGGIPGPLLAEKVDVSPDGKVYTFTLRKGVRFHNGAELTSADVLWSWNRYMDPKTEWRCLADFDGRNGTKVVSAEAPSPDTFVLTIDRLDAMFLDTMSRPDCGGTGIVHKSSVKADGSWDKPIGTGPFSFGEWKRGQSVQLLAFDGYASPKGDKRDGFLGAKKALVKEVRILAIPDGATVKAGLQSGAIDISSVPESEVSEVRKNPNLDIKTGTNPVRHGFILQTRDPLLSNVKIRQALAISIDYEELVGTVTSGLGKVNNSPVYDTSQYFGQVEKKGFSYDPAKARALLKEAGYKGEKISIIANKRATVPSFNSAVIAQQMWRSVGLNVDIDVLDWATQLDRYNKGNQMMASITYSPRFDPALGFEQISGPKDKQPRKVWENPKALALIEKASQTTDAAVRQPIFDELHAMLLEDVPVIFTHNDIDCLAHNKRITGLAPWASNLILWGVAKN
ncbi:ABC transporter substrate-binding protein [Bosea sp. 2RAB26]|uniref:ABC transporter substrate-binding protein n=1 Tax=Bosea sp. 2RAB26 TaxID=3237476 RepID=UPI003F8E5B72